MYVPVAVQMRTPELIGEGLKLPDVVGVGIEQHTVIIDPRRDEKIIAGVFAVTVYAVDEQPLDPCVADVAGVAGIVHPRGYVGARRAVAGREEAHLLLGKVCGLLEADNGVFLPLILIDVLRAVAVAKLYARAVGKYEYALSGVVACNAVKLPLHGDKVVFPKLREGPSQEQQVQPGVGKRQQNELSPHRPALASASRAAVCCVPCSGQEEFLLPFARNAFKL